MCNEPEDDEEPTDAEILQGMARFEPEKLSKLIMEWTWIGCFEDYDLPLTIPTVTDTKYLKYRRAVVVETPS